MRNRGKVLVVALASLVALATIGAWLLMEDHAPQRPVIPTALSPQVR